MKYTRHTCFNWFDTHKLHGDVPTILIIDDISPEVFGWGQVNEYWYCGECMEKITEIYERQLIVSKL
jgi:hypothetical protein